MNDWWLLQKRYFASHFLHTVFHHFRQGLGLCGVGATPNVACLGDRLAVLAGTLPAGIGVEKLWQSLLILLSGQKKLLNMD